MNKRFIIALAVAAAATMPRYVRAHEGHPHRLMGTVSARQQNRLDVRTTDGKLSTITVNEGTRVTRGKSPVPVDDIQPGERIVVVTMESKGKDGKVTLVATEVRLGAAKPRARE
jgi:hypothetical protein